MTIRVYSSNELQLRSHTVTSTLEIAWRTSLSDAPYISRWI